MRCRLPIALLILLAVAGLTGCPGCNGGHPPPPPATYQEKVSAFTIGTIALEAGDRTGHDRTNLTKASQIAPEEPAVWANLGLLELRAPKIEEAEKDLQKAEQMAPDNAAIQKLLGLLDGIKGVVPSAVQHYQKAVQLAPEDLRARYALKEQLERQGDEPGEAAAQEQIEAILQRQPYNLQAQLELARIAAHRNDAAGLKQAITLLQTRSATFTADSLTYFQGLKAAAGSAKFHDAQIQAVHLGNVLKQGSTFYRSYIALTGETQGEPLQQFLKLPPIPSQPSPPDSALTFTAQPLPGDSSGANEKIGWAGATYLDGGTDYLATSTKNEPSKNKPPKNEPPKMTTLMADGHAVRLPAGQSLNFPGGPKATPPGPHGVLALDVNYDANIDFALAGAGGFKLYEQDQSGAFADVTAKTGLPAAVLTRPYMGAWQVDIEADGDLDIVLAPVEGLPVVLRNNGDGTFKEIQPFAGNFTARDFAWADLDNGGNPWAIFTDAKGNLHIYANERGGLFRAVAVPPGVDTVAAVAVGDCSGAGRIDLVALQTDGKIRRIDWKADDSGWEVVDLAQWADASKDLKIGVARLFIADLDNNGGLDIVASTASSAKVWLCDSAWSYAPLASPITAGIESILDLNGDGRLDLIGVDPTGKPVELLNQGTLKYQWVELRPRAADSEFKKSDEAKGGDRRINTFGIGGDLEVRAGLLYQKQVIQSPSVHIGLGTYPALDVIRIVWPNGDLRADFNDAIYPDHPSVTNQSVIAPHRLHGSCPFLFTWNGKEMQFVTDCIWRSPLGLKINAQDTAGVSQTEDWVKIRGDQLVPRNGLYDLRITAELWETHFFDHLSLLTVDHPVGTEIWVDERFCLSPPKQKLITDPHTGQISAEGIYLTGPLQPVAKATDDLGHDVSDILREQDGRYLDTFGLGTYQGVTRDHYVEIELPPDAPKSGPLLLICQGWIHPTDSSINVALGQSHYPKPQGLSLETPDAQGRWSVARAGQGFPEGKLKTIVLDLNGIFKPDAPRKLRLRTNLEIYWDTIHWAAGITPQSPSPPAPSPRLPSLRLRSAGAAHRSLRSAGEGVGEASRRLRRADVSNPALAPSGSEQRRAGEGPSITIQHLFAQTAELCYRGFSVVKASNASSPELPESYDKLDTTVEKWRDLVGYYTRFGDVRELLAKTDDRYVIMNAGDELRLNFAAPSPPPSGMTRDYVLIGDGWVKDGNYNTTFSKTVLPLPTHARSDYNTPPGRLEDDPVYRAHRHDWEVYHTRYVAPDHFARGLNPNE